MRRPATGYALLMSALSLKVVCSLAPGSHWGRRPETHRMLPRESTRPSTPRAAAAFACLRAAHGEYLARSLVLMVIALQYYFIHLLADNAGPNPRESAAQT